MDNNQLVSVIRHMIAQRQALMYMDEALSRVLQADEDVAQAEKSRATILGQIEQDKASHEKDWAVKQSELVGIQTSVIDARKSLADCQRAIEARQKSITVLNAEYAQQSTEAQAKLADYANKVAAAKAEYDKVADQLAFVKADFDRYNGILSQLKK